MIGDMAMNIANGLNEVIDARKAAGAEAIADVARSARVAAEDLGGSPWAAHFVRRAADNVERAAKEIENRSVGELLGGVADFARRKPKMFFGFGLMAGVVVSRALRANREA